MNPATATGSGGEPEDSILDPHQYDELSEYSSEIETILDLLLDSLKDKDTIIRWSAAKGIGRVTNRLPRDYGDEVVQSILKGFTSRETSGTWHGGCMALAELGRRGLLLPETLKVTIPVVKKALVYDEVLIYLPNVGAFIGYLHSQNHKSLVEFFRFVGTSL